MVLHDSGQGGLVIDLRDPGGQLGVPHGGVSTDELIIVLCELGSLVGVAEVEVSTGRLGGIPLHAVRQLALHTTLRSGGWKHLRVLRCNGTEVRLDDRGVLALVETTWVSAGTEVLPALCLHGSIDALRSLALIEESLWLSERRSLDQRGRGQDGDERNLHGENGISRL